MIITKTSPTVEGTWSFCLLSMLVRYEMALCDIDYGQGRC